MHETEAGTEAIGLWFFRGSEHLLSPILGVVDAIAAMRPEVIIGVVTNGDDIIQRNKLDQLGLGDRVNVFVTNERAGVSKPDPHIFQLALDEAGAAPYESVFIGDIFDIDVVGALAAGMHAVWYNPAKKQIQTDLEADAERRHHELYSYADLAALLEMLDSCVIEP